MSQFVDGNTKSFVAGGAIAQHLRVKISSGKLAVAGLTDRERQVIEMRYGLGGFDPRTLEQCGEAFGVTRERVRQIETSTLRKIKGLPEAQALREAG